MQMKIYGILTDYKIHTYHTCFHASEGQIQKVKCNVQHKNTSILLFYVFYSVTYYHSN